MPWLPELFSAPVVERVKEREQLDQVVTVPYFDGLMAGELEALVGSFAGEPELHDPIRGRVKGRRAFEEFVTRTNGWLTEQNALIEDVLYVRREGPSLGEVVLHLDGGDGRVDLPVAVIADRGPDRHIKELRIYSSSFPLSFRHVNRPPLLQADPAVRASDVVGVYQDALADGDVDAIVATFEPDGYAREPAGGQYVHRGHDQLRAFYRHLFSNGGGIPLEHCAVIDDGRACVLEYNVVRWGATELMPQAGVAVYVRGPSGKLAAARIYDDTDPPLVSPS
jgi:SnoaL-like domain